MNCVKLKKTIHNQLTRLMNYRILIKKQKSYSLAIPYEKALEMIKMN